MGPSYDVVIIGGGPAGSTVGSLVKRYSPALRILLLESAHFPRHHVGESLLAGATPVLHEMGAYEDVRAFGFVEKLGASYVWGRDRRPWGFEFDDLIGDLVARGQRLPQSFARAWHVRRAEYDHLLLQRAATLGVEVRYGARVERACLDPATHRVVGVEFADDHGPQRVECALLVDCSGQAGVLAKQFRQRRYDDRMNNVAVWGYWRGARWKEKYVGHPNLARIFVATTPRGWIWYIPVASDVISVGLVTCSLLLRGEGVSPAHLYREELASCPEIAGLLDGATPTRIAPDQRRDVCTVRDWSYDSRHVVGPGWAMVGDAAGFVDPILSSGVMLAHELGQKAAYTINTAFQHGGDAEGEGLWDFYQETCRTYLRAYRDMAAFWYANNFSMESWWWEARRSMYRGDEAAQLASRQAFVRLASGYANRTESLSLFGSFPLHEASCLLDGLFGSGAAPLPVDREQRDQAPRLHPTARVTEGYYYWRGFVKTTRRVTNGLGTGHLDLHPGEEAVIDLFDGSRTVEEVDQLVAGIRALDSRLPLRTGSELAVQLDQIGALAK